MTARPIPFNRSSHLLKKAYRLVEDTELFFSDPDRGIEILLDALPYCQPPMVVRLLPLLGYAGKDKVLMPLFRLIVKPDQVEQVRISAAVQLGTASSQSRDPSTALLLLIDSLDHPEASVRSSCALALGWKANQIAITPLFLHLSDPDRDTQAAVVVALSAIGGRQVFHQLVQRLWMGGIEEKRSVLLNLWRFSKQIPQVEQVYLDAVDIVDPELVVDLVTGIGMIPLTDQIIDLYRRLLSAGNVGVKKQILHNLLSHQPTDYQELTQALKALAQKGEDRIQQLAIRLLARP